MMLVKLKDTILGQSGFKKPGEILGAAIPSINPIYTGVNGKMYHTEDLEQVHIEVGSRVIVKSYFNMQVRAVHEQYLWTRSHSFPYSEITLIGLKKGDIYIKDKRRYVAKSDQPNMNYAVLGNIHKMTKRQLIPFILSSKEV